MEREIKFRGKPLDSHNEWVYGWLGRIQEDDGSYSYYIKEDTTRHISNVTQTLFQVKPETIGQYTGLKDKNGKEIYEGDVIKYKDYSNGGVLSFGGEDKQPRRTTVIKFENIVTGFKAYGMAEFDVKHIEVIGNIHEHKHLINGN
jgi:uncharacterized phage protein (TIGR01671 family)